MVDNQAYNDTEFFYSKWLMK